MPECRHVKHVVILLLALYFLYNVAISIGKWMDGKIGETQTIKSAIEEIYPSVSFCPALPGYLSDPNSYSKNLSKYYEYKRNLTLIDHYVFKFHHPIELNNGTTYTVWKNDLHSETWTKMVMPDTRFWSNGIVTCATYNPPGPSKTNIMGVMDLTLQTEGIDEWWILMHNQRLRTSPITKSYGGDFLPHYVVNTEQLSGNQYEYEISRIGLKMIDQKDDPCINEEVNFDKCVEGYISSQMKCKLPWGSKNSSPELPLCSYAEEYDLFWNLSMTIIKSSEGEISSLTDCKPSCNRKEFSSKLLAVKKAGATQGSPLNLQIHYASNRIAIKEQYYTYDFYNLIADFGGYLGLLLGYSALGFVDTVIVILSKFKCFDNLS